MIVSVDRIGWIFLDEGSCAINDVPEGDLDTCFYRIGSMFFCEYGERLVQ